MFRVRGRKCRTGCGSPLKAIRRADALPGSFRLGADYQGSGGVLHGGIIALLLDEAMGKLSRFAEVRAVTAELNIEYLKPIHVDQEIFVEAFQAERKGRQFYHQAEIRNAAGVVLARGRGRFVAIGPRQ